MKKETIPGTRAVATRLVNAQQGFIDTVREILGCTQEDAEKVFGVYKDKKVLKLDVGIGRYSVKHGAFMEKDVLQNALGLAK